MLLKSGIYSTFALQKKLPWVEETKEQKEGKFQTGHMENQDLEKIKKQPLKKPRIIWQLANSLMLIISSYN